MVFVSNIFPNFYLFKADSETYIHSLNIQKEFQMSTAKRQNIDWGCKQEFYIGNWEVEETMHSAVKNAYSFLNRSWIDKSWGKYSKQRGYN